MTPGVAGVVLAGGASRRMGRDKALLQIDGVPLHHRTCAVLSGLFPRVVVAQGRRPLDLWPGCEAVADTAEDAGPIAGLHAALALLAADPGIRAAFVVPVDLPGLDAPSIRAFLRYAGTADAALLCEGRRLHAVPALFPVSCHDGLLQRLTSGEHRLRDAALSLHPLHIPSRLLASPHRRALLSDLDTPADAARWSRGARTRAAGECPPFA